MAYRKPLIISRPLPKKYVSQRSAAPRVLTGFQDPNNLQKAREMLDRFHLIVIDAAIADLAAKLRREHRWKLPDALQAAAAQKTD